MAAIVPFVMVASAVVGAIGAIQQGNAAKAAANFNATVNAQNATIARQNAAAQAVQVDRENYLRLGAIHAAQGKSGGAAGQGSVLDVLSDNTIQGKLQEQNVIYQGEMQARGYSNTAALDTTAGSNAQTAGYLKAGSELLSGGAKAYSSYDALTRGK